MAFPSKCSIPGSCRSCPNKLLSGRHRQRLPSLATQRRRHRGRSYLRWERPVPSMPQSPSQHWLSRMLKSNRSSCLSASRSPRVWVRWCWRTSSAPFADGSEFVDRLPWTVTHVRTLDYLTIMHTLEEQLSACCTMRTEMRFGRL